ncbi:MAG TPA: radical SAM protein [Bryobacteraceae bacterium]|nr:radical SAM protein [Bryobacteraceae bacterium]
MIRTFRAAHRRVRELMMIAHGLASTRHPVMAHLVTTRRCNLACAYCNEYDKVSPPVPFVTLRRRIDKLAELGTSVITLSGGEPLLNPDLDDVIHHIRRRGMIAGLITNGYFLTAERIGRFNAAGLDHLQISIDNVRPDEVSKKSLKVLDAKLRLLAEHALFHVNINSVIGAGDPNDALAVGRRAIELGFTSTVGILHDNGGQLRPLDATARAVFDEMRALRKTNFSRFNVFQENIAAGRRNEWRCRAGARYLYICEDGLVHYCSQQRGYPAVPLDTYSSADVRREFLTEKSCAPFCTVSCVHQVSQIDHWRAPQTAPPATPGLVQIEPAGR